MFRLWQQFAALITAGGVRISEHGHDALADDRLTEDDLLTGAGSAVVVEEYPDYPKGAESSRVPYGDEAEDWGASERPCHDCAAIMGEYHVPGCDLERSPACGGQLRFGCECEWPDDEQE